MAFSHINDAVNRILDNNIEFIKGNRKQPGFVEAFPFPLVVPSLKKVSVYYLKDKELYVINGVPYTLNDLVGWYVFPGHTDIPLNVMAALPQGVGKEVIRKLSMELFPFVQYDLSQHRFYMWVWDDEGNVVKLADFGISFFFYEFSFLEAILRLSPDLEHIEDAIEFMEDAAKDGCYFQYSSSEKLWKRVKVGRDVLLEGKPLKYRIEKGFYPQVDQLFVVQPKEEIEYSKVAEDLFGFVPKFENESVREEIKVPHAEPQIFKETPKFDETEYLKSLEKVTHKDWHIDKIYKNHSWGNPVKVSNMIRFLQDMPFASQNEKLIHSIMPFFDDSNYTAMRHIFNTDEAIVNFAKKITFAKAGNLRLLPMPIIANLFEYDIEKKKLFVSSLTGNDRKEINSVDDLIDILRGKLLNNNMGDNILTKKTLDADIVQLSFIQHLPYSNYFIVYDGEQYYRLSEEQMMVFKNHIDSQIRNSDIDNFKRINVIENLKESPEVKFNSQVATSLVNEIEHQVYESKKPEVIEVAPTSSNSILTELNYEGILDLELRKVLFDAVRRGEWVFDFDYEGSKTNINLLVKSFYGNSKKFLLGYIKESNFIKDEKSKKALKKYVEQDNEFSERYYPVFLDFLTYNIIRSNAQAKEKVDDVFTAILIDQDVDAISPWAYYVREEVILNTFAELTQTHAPIDIPGQLILIDMFNSDILSILAEGKEDAFNMWKDVNNFENLDEMLEDLLDVLLDNEDPDSIIGELIGYLPFTIGVWFAQSSFSLTGIHDIYNYSFYNPLATRNSFDISDELYNKVSPVTRIGLIKRLAFESLFDKLYPMAGFIKDEYELEYLKWGIIYGYYTALGRINDGKDFDTLQADLLEGTTFIPNLTDFLEKQDAAR